MPQKCFNVVGWVISMLVLSICLSCKKSNNGSQKTLDLLKNLTLIPGTNSFMVGSPIGEVDRDTIERQHEVALSSFYISKYELSRGEFKSFLQSKDTNYLTNNQRRIEDYNKDDAGNIVNWDQNDAHPILNISWNTAVRYCNWATKEILKSTDTAYIFINNIFDHWNILSKGIRLPTESEWEYACRANITTPFATGNSISTAQANYDGHYPYNQPYDANGKSMQRTIPVDTATYFKNSFGLEHMHGNVGEWSYDWYGTYPTTKQANPIGAITGSDRVIRGGGWANLGVYLRSASRLHSTPGSRKYYVGLRLAKTI